MISSKIFNSYANRGMNLEEDINITNKYYLDNDIAIIYKKPTPIKVSKVSYQNSHSKIIKEAFYEMPSTTDYNGIYKGKYIDFDAKEVKKNKSFALTNLHDHQIKHLKRIYQHGGISFILVRFDINNTCYLLETKKIIEFMENENRKSIPIEYFENNGYKIKNSYIPRLDYIKIIDKLYFNCEVQNEKENKENY